MGQDAEVALYAHQYNLSYLPAVFFYGMLDGTRRYLSSCKRTLAATLVQIFGTCLQMVNLHFLVTVKQMDIVGIGLSCCITNGCMWLLLEIYARFWVPELRSAYVSTHDAFRQPEFQEAHAYRICTKVGIYEYICIGMPSVFAICSEWWAY